MTNLDSILKSRDITLPTKVCLVKAMVFPVVMYGCESWIVKKADHWRTDAFELWCWRRLLRVPWTARRSNQSILKDISPGCSLEGLVLKLKLQYFGHLMRRVDSLEKPWCWEGLGAGGIGDDRRWDGWMASPTRWAWVWVDSGSRWWTGRPGVLWFMGLQRVGHDWATELNWGRPRQPKSAEQTNRGKWFPKETIVCVFREIHWSPWISTNVCLHDVKLCEKGKKVPLQAIGQKNSWSSHGPVKSLHLPQWGEKTYNTQSIRWSCQKNHMLVVG